MPLGNSEVTGLRTALLMAAAPAIHYGDVPITEPTDEVIDPGK